MSRRRYNWESVKATFVEGLTQPDGERTWPNLREVAAYHDVPYNRTRERSARDGWSDQRAAFQGRIERTRQGERAEALADEAVKLDALTLGVAKVGMQLVVSRVRDIAERVKKRTEEGQNEDDVGAFFNPVPLVDAREMEQLARAAAQWHGLAGKALGEVETTRHEITGPGGKAVEIEHTTLTERLALDDPDRLNRLMVVLNRSRIPQQMVEAPVEDAIEHTNGDSPA